MRETRVWGIALGCRSGLSPIRSALCIAAVLHCISLFDSAAAAETTPWMLSATAGYSPTPYRSDADGSAIPMLGIAKGFDQHWMLRVQVARAAYHYGDGEVVTFIPAGIGMRFYPSGYEGFRPLPFLEVTSLLARSRWEDRYGNEFSRASAGLFESVGLSIRTSDQTRVELAIGYIMTKDSKQVSYDFPPTYYDGLNQGLIALTVDLLLGH